MSEKYKTHNPDGAYFVTFTIVEWLKVFEDDSYKQIIIDNIRFYQETRGLIVYAYCIMPDHVHMIIQSGSNYSVSKVLRDLKKFTSRAMSGNLKVKNLKVIRMFFISFLWQASR
jgi:REP element-mobilizing transposase RayT